MSLVRDRMDLKLRVLAAGEKTSKKGNKYHVASIQFENSKGSGNVAEIFTTLNWSPLVSNEWQELPVEIRSRDGKLEVGFIEADIAELNR